MNRVPKIWACPKCKENRVDLLHWQLEANGDAKRVRCASCDTIYEPGVTVPAAEVKEIIG